MDSPEAIVSDEAIDAVWQGANFGPHLTKREVIRNTLLKFACGWSSGKTAHLIVAELGLARINKQTLTKLGQKYLWACYSKQNQGEIETLKAELANTEYLYNGLREHIIDLKAENSKMRKALENDWVSVDDRLPELTEPLMWYNDDNILEVGIENYKATVLAFHPQAGIYKAVLTKATGWSEISTVSNRALLPTHWRPLPATPIATEALKTT